MNTKQNNHEPKNGGELDWQAFRFVTGELNDAELQTFEARLDQEQAAREAVATAVELVQTISAAEHLVESPSVAAVVREANWWRRVAWTSIAVGVSACLAIVAFMAIGSRDDGPSLANGGAPNPMYVGAEAPLAAAWMEALDEGAFASEAFADESIDFDAILSGDEASSVVESNAAAPDWMVSALAGMSGANLDNGPNVELEN